MAERLLAVIGDCALGKTLPCSYAAGGLPAEGGRHRYVIRIDANRPGVYRWLITLEGRSVRKGVASDRDQAAAAVSDALDELPR
jgi:hypothetical protein